MSPDVFFSMQNCFDSRGGGGFNLFLAIGPSELTSRAFKILSLFSLRFIVEFRNYFKNLRVVFWKMIFYFFENMICLIFFPFARVCLPFPQLCKFIRN